MRPPRPGRYIDRIRVTQDADLGRYPFDIPVIRHIYDAGGLDFRPGVTFLVGDNGSGKSTLLEALAVAAGFNAEGGSQSFRFATRATESNLADHLDLRWRARPSTGYFLRAESFYNVATEIEKLEAVDAGLLASSYGGVSLHERSHGQSFLDLVVHRFGPGGLYLMDEPEAALSVPGCLALVSRIMELVPQRCQFVIATHSPILLAVPDARILQIDQSGALSEADYDDADPVRLTRGFLSDPGRFLHHLLAEDQ